MPEYLAPGVFIEEIPARLKAIEGVSTSTAGFVGNSSRGPVAGIDPFVGPHATNPVLLGFQVTLDPTPVLVTSFAEFTRQFGQPTNDLSRGGYLPHAAHAFFDNGGKRLYVARVTGAGAAGAAARLDTGALLRLTRQPRVGDTQLFLGSLRGVNTATASDITFRSVADGSVVQAIDVSAFNEQAGNVSVAALTQAQADALTPSRVYAEINGIAATSGNGPRFAARNPGAWGSQLRIIAECSDRPATTVAAPSSTDLVQVVSAASFYRGAVVSLVDNGGVHRERVVIDILPGNTLRVSAAITVVAGAAARVVELDITVQDLGTGALETFRGLSWNATNDPDIRSRHYATVINGRSRLVYVQPAWAGLDAAPAAEAAPTMANMPMTPRASALALTGGADETATPTAADLLGIDDGPGHRSGIESLADADDIRIVAAPGYTDAQVHNALITQCERMRYRFAVLDGEAEPLGITSILTHRNAYDSSFAAYYAPWVRVGSGDTELLMPPSGYVAGIYARTDNDRGVYKAPANEPLRQITGLRSYITTGEQEVLNPRGVNCIRRFDGRGILVWGARTLSSDPEFRYLNVRRYLIFMEASIDRGTQWVVFEPNSPETWGRLVDSVSAFLNTQWRGGALFGRRPEDAFFVRCDETTMTADDVQNGRLICNIGVAIVRPAEFVIFQIEQITGFAQQ